MSDGSVRRVGNTLSCSRNTASRVLALALAGGLFVSCPGSATAALTLAPATNLAAHVSPDSVAIANGASYVVSVRFGTGTGTFGAATNFDAHTAPESVAMGDLNGDGRLDLAVANFNSSDVSVLLGTGAGSFAAATNVMADSLP